MYNAPIMTLGVLTLYVNVHPNTVKRYVKYGLIKPCEVKNLKLYSIKDLNKICFILFLTKEKFYRLKEVKELLDFLGKEKIKQKHYIFYVEKFKKNKK